MRALTAMAVGGILALASLGCGSATVSSTDGSSLSSPAAQSGSKGVIAGFAFVDSSVTSQGGGAKLPAGVKVYPPGSTITGTEGCPTNQYHTDGQPVVVIDYSGRPTAGSVQVTRHPAAGGNFADAPYYLDVNPGRILQNLGPIFDNGTYDVVFTYDYNTGKGQTSSAKLVLSRSCSH